MTQSALSAMGAASRRRGVESSIMRCQPDSASCQAERLLCKTACCPQPRDCLNVRSKFQLRHLTANAQTHTQLRHFSGHFFFFFLTPSGSGLGSAWPGPVCPPPGEPRYARSVGAERPSVRPSSAAAAAAAHAAVRLMCCENTCPPRLLSPGGGRVGWGGERG